MKLRYPLLAPLDRPQSKLVTFVDNMVSVVWVAILILGAIYLFGGLAFH